MLWNKYFRVAVHTVLTDDGIQFGNMRHQP